MRTMSDEMQSSYDAMMDYAKRLTAEDFNTSVQLTTVDASWFEVHNAFIMEDEDAPYIWLLCEHYGHMIFHKDDIEEYFVYMLGGRAHNG